MGVRRPEVGVKRDELLEEEADSEAGGSNWRRSLQSSQ